MKVIWIVTLFLLVTGCATAQSVAMHECKALCSSVTVKEFKMDDLKCECQSVEGDVGHE